MAEVNVNVESRSTSGYGMDVTIIDLYSGEEWHQWEIIDGQLEKTSWARSFETNEPVW